MQGSEKPKWKDIKIFYTNIETYKEKARTFQRNGKIEWINGVWERGIFVGKEEEEKKWI